MPILRKRGDSNPRYSYPYDSLANCWFQPLTHPSKMGHLPKSGAKVLLFFDMSKFLTKKVPKICFFTLNYSFGRINLAQ